MTGEFKKADGDGMVIVSISGSEDSVPPLAIPTIALLETLFPRLELLMMCCL
jgi:hypothetical protein